MLSKMKSHLVPFVGGGLAVAVVAAGLAYAVASASGDSSTPGVSVRGIPAVVEDVAKQYGVSNVEARVVTSDGKLGLFVGVTGSGEAMVSFGGPQLSTPFVPLQDVLSRKNLELLSIGGGASSASVDFADVVGIVSARVTRLEVLTAGGQQRQLVPQNNAFAYAASSPDDFALGVKAYGASGELLDSKSITPASPLDEG